MNIDLGVVSRRNEMRRGALVGVIFGVFWVGSFFSGVYGVPGFFEDNQVVFSNGHRFYMDDVDDLKGTGTFRFRKVQADEGYSFGNFTVQGKFSQQGDFYLTGDLLTTGKVKVKSGTTSEQDLMPAGIIIMWTKNKVPYGWVLCDGENKTPDLRDRFIRGSDKVPTVGAGVAFHKHTYSHELQASTIDFPLATGNVTTPPTVALTFGNFTGTAGVAGGNDDDDALEFTHNHLGISAAVSNLVWTDDPASAGVNVSFTNLQSNSVDNDPPYYTVVFIQKKR